MFDNVAGDADGPFMNPQQVGGIRIVFQLGANVGRLVTAVIYGEFENVMEITKEGGVLYNTYAGN